MGVPLAPALATYHHLPPRTSSGTDPGGFGLPRRHATGSRSTPSPPRPLVPIPDPSSHAAVDTSHRCQRLTPRRRHPQGQPSTPATPLPSNHRIRRDQVPPHSSTPCPLGSYPDNYASARALRASPAAILFLSGRLPSISVRLRCYPGAMAARLPLLRSGGHGLRRLLCFFPQPWLMSRTTAAIPF